jgi:hypothetical protein
MSSPTRSCPATRARFSLVSSIRGSRALDSLAYLDAGHGAEVPAAIERSRSGEGAHVWVFFEEAVPATMARSLGTSLLREAMAARAKLDLSSYDWFFPSQDSCRRARSATGSPYPCTASASSEERRHSWIRPRCVRGRTSGPSTPRWPA